jgi:hypothetical protein
MAAMVSCFLGKARLLGQAAWQASAETITPAEIASHPRAPNVVPALIADLGDEAAWRYVEFFTANIRNPHTRRAYARAGAPGAAQARNLRGFVRFRIDECLSVDLVAVAGETGHEAQHVARVGHAGWKDWNVVRYAKRAISSSSPTTRAISGSSTRSGARIGAQGQTRLARAGRRMPHLLDRRA